MGKEAQVFEEIAGLPLHPLAVHAPIILVPLLIAVASGYAVIPRVRRWLGWTVVAFALLAPGSVLLARLSGNAFRNRLTARDQLPPELAARVDEHAGTSLILLWLVVALALVSAGMVLLSARTRHAVGPDAGETPHTRGPGGVVMGVLVAVVVLGLAAVTGWYLVQTGDSGARMVWEGS